MSGLTDSPLLRPAELLASLQEAFTSGLSTDRSPSPSPDITTVATGRFPPAGLPPAGSAASVAAPVPHLPDADLGGIRHRSNVGSPGSRARSVRTCQGLRPRQVSTGTCANAPVRVAFHPTNGVGTWDKIQLFRGRNGHCWPPPAQIRASAANALGSYLECVTTNRRSGHGCSTRGVGRKRAMSRLIRCQFSRVRWLRRRRLRYHLMLM
jgi:hypothetical protein